MQRSQNTINDLLVLGARKSPLFLPTLTNAVLILHSSQEVQLREGGGEAAGETREETSAAAGAEREESSGEEKPRERRRY